MSIRTSAKPMARFLADVIYVEAVLTLERCSECGMTFSIPKETAQSNAGLATRDFYHAFAEDECNKPEAPLQT